MSRLLAKRSLSKKRRRKLFYFWLVVLILAFAFFANIIKVSSSLIGALNKPSSFKLTFENFDREKVTGVVIADPLLLATFDPIEKMVHIFEMPSNLYLETPDGGFYLASQFKNLKQGDEGVKLLVNTLFANLAIPVDFYLQLKDGNITSAEVSAIQKKLEGSSSLLWLFELPSKSGKLVKTNVTLFDQFKLLWQLRSVRRDKFIIEKAQNTNFEEVLLPDGSKILKIATDGLSPEFLANFADIRIASEGLTVGIYNAAGKPGLAQLTSKICKNLGIQAAVSGDADKTEPVTRILAKSDKISSLTVKRLQKTFGVRVEKQTDEQLEDIKILVGKDMAVRFSFN